MANRISMQAKHSIRLRSPAVHAPILKPIPMLLAALLVGCASSAHHTTGALKQQPQAEAPAYQPPHHTSSVTPSPAPPPPEQAHAQKDEGAPEPNRAVNETNTPTPEEDLAQRPSADVAVPADEGVVAQQVPPDAVPAKDEAIVAPEQFADSAPPIENDGVAHQPRVDDAAMDEDIATQPPSSEETPGVKDAVVATEEYAAAPAAPEPLVHTPKPLPVKKMAQAEGARPRPVTVLPMTVTVAADPLFEFDRDAIGAEARRKLDELIQQLKGIPYGEVITLGYTDPIGTEAYNHKLSERRAESVTRYLVSNGIPADKIRVEGRGETEEFASYKECKRQGKQKLIECLQPDRRVEVTVTTAKEQ